MDLEFVCPSLCSGYCLSRMYMRDDLLFVIWNLPILVTSKNFYLIICKEDIFILLYKMDCFREDAICLGLIICHTGQAQSGSLPEILFFYLSNGDVKSILYSLLYTFDDLSLSFQGIHSRDMKFNSRCPNYHSLTYLLYNRRLLTVIIS